MLGCPLTNFINWPSGKFLPCKPEGFGFETHTLVTSLVFFFLLAISCLFFFFPHQVFSFTVVTLSLSVYVCVCISPLGNSQPPIKNIMLQWGFEL